MMWMRGLLPLLLTAFIACSPDEDSGRQTKDSKTRKSRKTPPEHAVIVHIKLSDDNMGKEQERKDLQALESRLENSINSKHAGEFDGDEFGEGYCTLYMYGPDADALFSSVESLLKAASLPSGSYATKRYRAVGDPKTREIRMEFR